MARRGPISFLLLVLLAAALRLSASTALCDSQGGHRFDFWIGDWVVDQEILDSDGSWLHLPAASSVRREVGGCALVERWSGRVRFFWEGMKSIEPLRGLSVRSYSSDDGTWSIWWMDSRHPRFTQPFVGRFEGEVGSFYRRTAGPDGGPRTTRIRFIEAAGGRVEWDLATSRDGGESWTTLWKMHFRRWRPGEGEPERDSGPG